VSPSGDGLLDPVCGSHLVHDSSIVNQLCVSLFGNEVRVTPVWWTMEK
jgi:hypothetical protein